MGGWGEETVSYQDLKDSFLTLFNEGIHLFQFGKDLLSDRVTWW